MQRQCVQWAPNRAKTTSTKRNWIEKENELHACVRLVNLWQLLSSILCITLLVFALKCICAHKLLWFTLWSIQSSFGSTSNNDEKHFFVCAKFIDVDALRKASASCWIKCGVMFEWSDIGLIFDYSINVWWEQMLFWRECFFMWLRFYNLHRTCALCVYEFCHCITVGATRNTGPIQTEDDRMQFQFTTHHPIQNSQRSECQSAHTVGVDFSLFIFCSANATKSSFWQMKIKTVVEINGANRGECT